MHAAAGHDEAAAERFDPEPDKRPGRTAFQRDRARVQHSAALRRLAGKTQVVTPDAPAADAAPRTRLTHSLECAQIGRDLGAAFGCDPDIVEAACLAHDLGHPPFGHNGERVLAVIAEPCGGFEGNAQSLRLLTRLEPKRFAHTDGRSVGLNLTRATLDAATKYPWPRGGHPTEPASPKFGVYADDMPVFTWLRQDAPGARRCFEAQVMDWADDVAYSVHDLEDGLHAGHLDPAALRAGPEREEVFAVAAERYAPPGTGPAELAAALDRLRAQEWWPHTYDGGAPAQARLKDATSQLIGRFCLAAERATRERFGPGPLRRYAAELVLPPETRLECDVLKAVAHVHVVRRPDQERLRARQRAMLTELGDALAARAPDGLDPQYRALFETAPDDAARLRVIVDQLAALTDAAARSLHARLVPVHRPRG
ncbi:deoxyguanosinetriphosphate triphosphohydrolase [Streptomyces litchfieldiae]|uniref:Deoxyguanosinetriphosphate triphosphohydrolase-like protein n=1 Tax=Streptomyces litchfieldiae TaxID=3075543 RepID=A0ABU2MU90_9ACTN|nr:deoxyguanosinetriphosphate triphosphohydrolase [Streptomyces sp. DSM 44938]MDT0345215.1 deoxyguanosinetriphosphate triphosphohydrolase [Streptomyces sp. DSM 44938]